MIAPHRSNRKVKTQDGRRLRRYERRWLVERYFAWLQWKRRILIRCEYYSENFLGFVPSVFAGLLTVIMIGLLVENLIFRTIERRTVRKWGLQG